MEHNFALVPLEMQPHGAPGPGTTFSHRHTLGHPTHPSRLSGGVTPLIPVLRKTVRLDAFPQSHVQTSSRLGMRARAQSMSPQDPGIAPGASRSPPPANSLVPRKLSSISLTIRQNSHTRPLVPVLSPWEELPTLGREAATHGGGRLSAPRSPALALRPDSRVHSEGPGNPGLSKSSRTPTVEKPVVGSYLALPFQSRLSPSSLSPPGPGPSGQGYTRTSPGRGKSQARGIPRPRLCLQRATSVMNLAAVHTARPDVARRLTTMATKGPSLAASLPTPDTSRLDTGTEFSAVDTKWGSAMDLSTAGTAKPGKARNLATAGTNKSGTAMNLATAETTKLAKVMNLATTERDELGKSMVTADAAKPGMTTRGTAMAWAIPHPRELGTTRLDTAVALMTAKPAELGPAMDSPALDRSRLGTAMGSGVLVTPDPADGKKKPGNVNNLATSDIAIYPLMPSRGPEPAQDLATADAATKPAALDLARECKGLPETRTDAAMSELVPEPRPKPAVPMKPSINSNLLGYIGIDTIIEQMRKKTMKTGFDFNIMVVGQSGLGKSTLVNTLFKSQVSRKAASWNREEKIPKTVEIKAIGHVIEEGGVKMKLTVIDTPGFGDQINNENCWEPIEKYINEQYEKFLKEEVNIARKKRIPDTRVHCCLYFISPTGHSLRPLDLEFMKHLSKVVNIIPVIAKADTMTPEEKSEFKQRVRKELEVNGIEFYPQKEFDEDLEDKTENDKIRWKISTTVSLPYFETLLSGPTSRTSRK
ncbi:neuronal-specific septin-3 isoform X2 [Fukomys damarensis]|uniref:neuronal-specific septin-3 isoform X2 n=1 Tax=Fukomys damarensis TaxID=885580 RepID=UPI0008FF33C3|nr:neuronal-specific septin-3 isoform X2 [Fukomys damarensis]